MTASFPVQIIGNLNSYRSLANAPILRRFANLSVHPLKHGGIQRNAPS